MRRAVRHARRRIDIAGFDNRCMCDTIPWRIACPMALLLVIGAARGAATDSPGESALSWGAALTVDTLRVDSRVVRSTALGHLELHLGVDAAKLFG